MLKTIFLWIYCMDFHEVLILLAMCTGLFYAAQIKFGNWRFWKAAVLAVLLVWATVVIAQTILWRTPASTSTLSLQPFQSYFDALQEGGQRELLRSNFMNAVLFYPAGLLLTSILPKKAKPILRILIVLVASVVFSTIIEFTQFQHCLGFAQTDDVIHAVLGALTGSTVMLILP